MHETFEIWETRNMSEPVHPQKQNISRSHRSGPETFFVLLHVYLFYQNTVNNVEL